MACSRHVAGLDRLCALKPHNLFSPHGERGRGPRKRFLLLKQLQPSENSEDWNRHVVTYLRKYFLYLADQSKAMDLEATADGIDLSHYLEWLPLNGVQSLSMYASAVRRLLRNLPGGSRAARPSLEDNIKYLSLIHI